MNRERRRGTVPVEKRTTPRQPQGNKGPCLHKEAGIGVPEQVSVVGFDNARRSDTSLVPLTTIDQNPSLMAQLALERAVGRAEDRYLPTQQVLVPRLVERASTGPASS